MLEIKPVPAFRDNYIWLVIEPATRQTAIVDPGEAEPVFAAIREAALQPCAILVTHHHADHVGGITALLGEYPVPVFGPASEDIPGRTVSLRSGNRIGIDALDATFDVLEVPGHTLGHIAYIGHGAAFVGDTLFMGGCGRLFEGTPGQMLDSLDRLASLPGDTRAYCAHEYTVSNLRFAATVEPGNTELAQRIDTVQEMRARGLPTVPGTIAVERNTNPFLRSRVPSVRAAASRHAGHDVTDPVEVFAIIRAWKDNYRDPAV
jgi:hydroxyacylglutathione hydrolase